MGPERRRYKYRCSQSGVLLKIAVPKNFFKSLKILVNLQAREEKISVSTFASPLTF